MQKATDKIILSTEDNEQLSDYFSRKENGDTCAFKGTASLDENDEGIVTLSVDSITFEMPKAKAKGKGKTGSAAEQYLEPDEEAAEPAEESAE